jgi:hypothetical protein
LLTLARRTRSRGTRDRKGATRRSSPFECLRNFVRHLLLRAVARDSQRLGARVELETEVLGADVLTVEKRGDFQIAQILRGARRKTAVHPVQDLLNQFIHITLRVRSGLGSVPWLALFFEMTLARSDDRFLSIEFGKQVLHTSQVRLETVRERADGPNGSVALGSQRAFVPVRLQVLLEQRSIATTQGRSGCALWVLLGRPQMLLSFRT